MAQSLRKVSVANLSKLRVPFNVCAMQERASSHNAASQFALSPSELAPRICQVRHCLMPVEHVLGLQSHIHKSGVKRLYIGFETYFAPPSEGAGCKTRLESQL